MMPPFEFVFPTNRIAYFVEVSLLFYLAQQVNLIRYLYYGKRRFDVQYIEETLIIDILDEITFKRRESFYANYTRKELNLLPNDFYAYYNKHAKILKEEQ